MEKLNTIFFYHLDKAIRNYRQYATQQLKEAGFSITIDQWLVLKVLHEDPEVTQSELAEKVLKDKASVTRIIEILVKDKYLQRKSHDESRRRYKLIITQKGLSLLSEIQTVVLRNRRVALKGVEKNDLDVAENVLRNIAENCSK
ncbi:MAG: MarR family transcriptional regulator [Flavobacteriales bacterium]|nr:MarR family transcriptional regulator [Flavobacteriales bacterium]